MLTLDTHVSLGIFALTKDGSQKKVKDMGGLAKRQIITNHRKGWR